ncbi:8298_t:CDS:2 [Scutellospora calospora]|uniref:8298_t:CDS:1 n=1 Tax=Scutellospora calospora TaxID=85575 RepID=A0ACA9JUY0_9GLOM|nr:8298_t:CDS:2 [Scutellospora calospora]
MSEVQGSFTFDVVEQKNDFKIGQIKLIFDVPYDTNRYSRSINYKIIRCSNTIIEIKTEEKWGGIKKDSCEKYR